MSELTRESAVAQPDRRTFLHKLGGVGLLGVSANLLAQQTPSPAVAPAPAAPIADPNSWSNAEIMSGKDAAVLKVHSERPLTASATAEYMQFDVTPTRRMFIRNNLNVPKLDAAQHVLRIQGLVEKPIELRLDDLMKLGGLTTQAMLECAGSGRTGFNPVPRGTPWPADSGMGCPKWTGVPLMELLKRAGLQSNARHVAFIGADTGPLPTVPKVIRSIPIDKAMERHTMVAYGMNDEALLPVHGFPMRALVPGWAGSASIKWLTTIEVIDAPFKGPYMDPSYRIPAYPLAPGDKMPADSISTEAWPVKSIITSPASNSRFKGGALVVITGKAWAGDNRIRVVEVSFDEGISWKEADLNRLSDRYAWTPFVYEFRPERVGYHTVLARARDNRGNMQPLQAAWNPHGYFYNAVQRVGFIVENA